MINRSLVKYVLKKILPILLYRIILFFWQKILLRVVTALDAYRLKKFTTTKLVHLTHSGEVFSLYISPKNGFIDKHIFLYGVYEPFILDIISKYLESGMTYVDIGANIGQHSMYAASIVGTHGKVHAYEPIPKIYRQLLASSKTNGYANIIHAHNYALGEKESIEILNVSKDIGGSSLVNQNDNTEEKIRVVIKKGDDELLTLSHVDMIKIDVEGYELEVLSGIKDTLIKHHPTLLLEYSGQFYKNNTDKHGIKILTLLTEYGYILYDIEDDTNVIKNINTFDSHISNKRVQTNLLCRYQK